MFDLSKQEKLKRLFQDPEWKLVDEMLREYVDPLKDIFAVDLTDTAVSVKGEIKAKKQFYSLIIKFLSDAQAIATNEILTDKRDSME